MSLDRESDPTSFILENFIEAFRQDRPFPITNQNFPETVSTPGQLVQLNNVPLYQPLPPDSRHIRVAIISPGIWREVVQCELKLLDLSNESEQYEAISYCWGDEQDKATIIINGNNVPVTKSLNDALKRLRTREKKRTVWADAICINQDDLKERQQQVELMKNIYSRATEVQVFTGESLVSSLNLQSGGLFEWDEPRICRWYNDTRDLPMLQIFTRLVEMERDDDIGATCLRPQMAEICAIAILLALGKDQCFHQLAAESFESPSSATWAAGISILEDFLKQPWWLRVWVVQEVVLAKRATVHFGQCVFPWELLEDIYWKIVGHRDSGCCIQSTDTVLPKPTWWMIDRLVLKVAPLVIQRVADDDGFSGTLLGLLSMSRIRDASDQRDKVYGVLGLLPQGWWEYSAVEPIKPDYTKPVVSLYTEVCWKLILHSGDLRILSHNTPAKVTQGLPSWVPDWSYSGTQMGRAALSNQFTWDFEQPLGGTKAIVALESCHSDPSSVQALRLRGVSIGKISQTVILPNAFAWEILPERATEDFPDSEAEVALLIERCRVASQLIADTAAPLVDGDLSPVEARFWSTLFGDKYKELAMLERHPLYMCWTRRGRTENTQADSMQDEDEEERYFRLGNAWRYLCARTYFVLDNGFLGMTTVDCLPGDEVYWFLGSRHPFILREMHGTAEEKTETSAQKIYGQAPRQFELLGPCDVPDVMNGDWVWKEEGHDVILC